MRAVVEALRTRGNIQTGPERTQPRPKEGPLSLLAPAPGRPFSPRRPPAGPHLRAVAFDQRGGSSPLTRAFLMRSQGLVKVTPRFARQDAPRSLRSGPGQFLSLPDVCWPFRASGPSRLTSAAAHPPPLLGISAPAFASWPQGAPKVALGELIPR